MVTMASEGAETIHLRTCPLCECMRVIQKSLFGADLVGLPGRGVSNVAL